ncbi:MAG TPA: hypothetical protein VID48_09295 [Solirubrobacteraceae bacterium]
MISFAAIMLGDDGLGQRAEGSRDLPTRVIVGTAICLAAVGIGVLLWLATNSAIAGGLLAVWVAAAGGYML